jgi:hypothetical protein
MSTRMYATVRATYQRYLLEGAEGLKEAGAGPTNIRTHNKYNTHPNSAQRQSQQLAENTPAPLLQRHPTHAFSTSIKTRNVLFGVVVNRERCVEHYKQVSNVRLFFSSVNGLSI